MTVFERLLRRERAAEDGDADPVSVEAEVETEGAERSRSRGRTLALGLLTGGALAVWWRRRRNRTAEIERETMSHAE